MLKNLLRWRYEKILLLAPVNFRDDYPPIRKALLFLAFLIQPLILSGRYINFKTKNLPATLAGIFTSAVRLQCKRLIRTVWTSALKIFKIVLVKY